MSSATHASAQKSSSSPQRFFVPDQPWHMTAEATLSALHTPAEGLTNEEARRRRQHVGPNALRVVEPVSLWRLLIRQLQSLVVLLLVAAAAVALAFGDVVEAVAIGAVLVLNTAIGFGVEWRAVRSMEALRKVGHVPTVVRRNGQVQKIKAEDVVPGDLVVLDEGDVITADLRLVDTSRLQVDESALTGESVPVDKSEAPVPEDITLAERDSMAYKGTSVTRGSAEGVVVATGMATELGAISELVEQADNGATPLEERLDQLARSLVGVVLGLVVAISVIGFISGRDLRLMVETGIALAVAAIPEGLPVVATIALARGLRRMARRNALARRLSSVETLGATQIICTDKTGTLTENRMTVSQLLAAGIDLASDLPERSVSDDASDPRVQMATWIGALCNAATLDPDDPATVVGDPMEGALLHFARDRGVDVRSLNEQIPEVQRVAFERETKMMASVRDAGTSPLVLVKGAPEAILNACTHEFASPCSTNGASSSNPLGVLWTRLRENRQPMTEARRSDWLQSNERLARTGLRVLGLAVKQADPAAGETTEMATAEVYADLTFAGMVGLVDPPRADVRDAIQSCHSAGIRVVMVTGDQPATAQYIANAVGLVDIPDAPVVHGQAFDALLSDSDSSLLDATIFARVTPKQKLDLIDAHQARGQIVAMTGDGVNDAPALRRADIGVAMGQRGTQVAQEAADIVLQDDAFSTIVAAVEEGRAIFQNIRSFVRYLLSCNVGEVAVVGIAALAGTTIPLLPLQILFLNLVTDVFPALALGMNEAESDVMDQKPRPSDEPVLTRDHWIEITGYGSLFAASVLGAMFVSRYRLGFSVDEAVTVSFLTLALGQLWHVFNMRSRGEPLLHNVVVQNKYVWGAVALCLALVLIAVNVPPIASVLSLVSLPAVGWGVVVAASFIPLIVGQIFITIARRSVEQS